MNNISLFVNKENKEATLDLSKRLDQIDFPDNVLLAINNLNNAESGVRRGRTGDKIVDISLADCYTMEDVVRELIKLVAAKK